MNIFKGALVLIMTWSSLPPTLWLPHAQLARRAACIHKARAARQAPCEMQSLLLLSDPLKQSPAPAITWRAGSSSLKKQKARQHVTKLYFLESFPLKQINRELCQLSFKPKGLLALLCVLAGPCLDHTPGEPDATLAFTLLLSHP